MSAEKKVLLLFLSLITLMVVCVYTHIDEIMLKNGTVIVQENQDEIKDEIKVENKDEVEDVKNVEVNEEENLLKEETPLPESISPLETEEVKEEIVEEPVEPLITSDKRYNRVGNEKNIEDLSTDAQLLQIKINNYVKENPIVFNRASNNITRKSVKTVDLIAEALKEFPNIKIEIAGHTDAAGPEELNQRISYQRAKRINDILLKLEIDKNRMTVRGYGESIPMVKNSPQGYSKINRRVEFNIIGE